jgi:SAM-dependent methyltransferase
MANADSSIRTLCIVVSGARSASDVGTLIELAQSRGWAAFVVATPSALQFLDTAAIERLTGTPVRSAHRAPAEQRANSAGSSSALIVAPATFNMVNKIAAGISDEYALSVVAEAIGLRIPVAIVPLVNDALASRTPYRRAVESLREEGVRVLENASWKEAFNAVQPLGSEYFDTWYADMASSQVRDRIVAQALDLTEELEFPGVLTGPAIGEMTEALRLPPGGVLLDIACGRGGYGIEIAKRTDASLIGVDFSAVALEQARKTGERRLPGRTEFRLGTLTETGLPTGAADGLMCVDAVQFAAPPLAGLLEFRRILKPGGRLVLTCWEAVDRGDEQVPARILAVDLQRDLTAAGFVDVEVFDKPDWRQAERTIWEVAVAADSDDPAVHSLAEEGRRSLDTFDSMRRVYATATAPTSAAPPGPA